MRLLNAEPCAETMPALPPALTTGERGDGPPEAHRQARGSQGTARSGEGRASRGPVPSVWGLLHRDGSRVGSRNRMDTAGDALPDVSPRVPSPARRRVERLWWMLRSEQRQAGPGPWLSSPWPGRAAEVAARASGGENCVMYRHSGAPAGELLGVKIAVSEEALVPLGHRVTTMMQLQLGCGR